MNSAIIRVRKRILQKLKNQYIGGKPGDETKMEQKFDGSKFWKCNTCDEPIVVISHSDFKRRKDDDNEKCPRCGNLVNENNFDIVNDMEGNAIEEETSPPVSNMTPSALVDSPSANTSEKTQVVSPIDISPMILEDNTSKTSDSDETPLSPSGVETIVSSLDEKFFKH